MLDWGIVLISFHGRVNSSGPHLYCMVLNPSGADCFSFPSNLFFLGNFASCDSSSFILFNEA